MFQSYMPCSPHVMPIFSNATPACNWSGDHELMSSKFCVVDGHAFKRVKCGQEVYSGGGGAACR